MISISLSSDYLCNSSKIKQENDWVELAKNNPSNFAPLYNKYYKSIMRYIQSKVYDQQLTEDIVSQVFLKAILNIDRYTSKGYSFGAWLFKIAHNEIIQSYRSIKNESIEDFDLLNRLKVESEDDFSEFDLDQLKIALKSIRYKQLEIIQLRYFESLSFKEIAIQLNISETAAKVRCFRAIEKLRELFMTLK
ncbi:MAG: RNA polymerase sigma factor [Crocinitomicaceae bacterium]|jgi:RNA polymerase sigma-70 factor (ECF subfamily)|nr:RNA polymerase sigma factor [Crocinitomicaceae bacterium]